MAQEIKSTLLLLKVLVSAAVSLLVCLSTANQWPETPTLFLIGISVMVFCGLGAILLSITIDQSDWLEEMHSINIALSEIDADELPIMVFAVAVTQISGYPAEVTGGWPTQPPVAIKAGQTLGVLSVNEDWVWVVLVRKTHRQVLMVSKVHFPTLSSMMSSDRA